MGEAAGDAAGEMDRAATGLGGTTRADGLAAGEGEPSRAALVGEAGRVGVVATGDAREAAGTGGAAGSQAATTMRLAAMAAALQNCGGR